MSIFGLGRRRGQYAALAEKEKRPEIPAILLPETKPEVSNEHANTEKACKKCGKEFQRGLYMHEKHCKGV